MAFSDFESQRDSFRDGLDAAPLGGRRYRIDGREFERFPIPELLAGAHAAEWAAFEDADETGGMGLATFGDPE